MRQKENKIVSLIEQRFKQRSIQDTIAAKDYGLLLTSAMKALLDIVTQVDPFPNIITYPNTSLMMTPAAQDTIHINSSAFATNVESMA